MCSESGHGYDSLRSSLWTVDVLVNNAMRVNAEEGMGMQKHILVFYCCIVGSLDIMRTSRDFGDSHE